MKKKRCKFNVELTVEELSSIPLLNGMLFCKVRLLHGGDFSAITSSKEVVNHCVKWMSAFKLNCKLPVNASSGVLETSLCRLSVRKETKGGKTFEKLGYADINFAEFAGCGLVSKRYILDGYNERSHRQDNSILKITINMTLTSGDPLFRPQVPHDTSMLLAASESEATRATANDTLGLGSIVTTAGSVSDDFRRTMSDSRSGFSTLPQSRTTSVSMQQTHSRTSSASHHSISSHSRSSSLDTTKKYSIGLSGTLQSRKSNNSNDSIQKDGDHSNILSPVKTIKRDEEIYRNIDDTRVNADDVIDQLINGQDFTADSSLTDEGNQLSLFIAKDGTASALAGYDMGRQSMVSGGRRDVDHFRTL